MGDQHRGVARALEDLAGRMAIADDGPHVAFVVGVMPDGRPTMWIAQPDGTQHDLDRCGFARTCDPAPTDADGRRDAPWTIVDLIDAASYFRDVSVILPQVGAGDRTHAHAIRRHEHRQEHLLRHMIAVTERRN